MICLTNLEPLSRVNNLPQIIDKTQAPKGERIAKYLSRAGIASRRDIEKFILAGKVSVNNKLIDTPVTFVTNDDLIMVDGVIANQKQAPQLWAYYKPQGCLTSKSDPENRTTIYDLLPDDLPYLMPVGRLDYNSEGLLLLTNDGSLKRFLEHPSNQVSRRYKVRAFGALTQRKLDNLSKGIVIDQIHYAPIYAELDKIQGKNSWSSFTLTEGKNREIRKVMEHLDCKVNRLIRTDYGHFSLGKMRLGEIKQIPESYWRKKELSKDFAV